MLASQAGSREASFFQLRGFLVKRLLIPITVALLFAVSSGIAFADPMPAVSFVGTIGPARRGGSFSMGYSFRTNQDVYATHLGVYDAFGNGFTFGGTQRAALYTANRSLLATTTVSSSDPLIGNFRYAPIQNSQGQEIFLPAGQTFVVTANTAPEGWAAANRNTFQVDPRISFLNARFGGGNNANFPNSRRGNPDFFGGNLIVTTPEPSSLVLFGLITAGSAGVVG